MSRFLVTSVDDITEKLYMLMGFSLAILAKEKHEIKVGGFHCETC